MAKKPTEFTPFPKTSRGQIDRERLKAEWLESDAMTLHTFCKQKNYNKDQLTMAVPCNSWRREKIAHLVSMTDEEAENTAVRARSTLIFSQLKAVQDMPVPLFGLLRLHQYMVKRHENNAAQEIRDMQELKHLSTGYKTPFTLTPTELMHLASAGRSITDALQAALYIAPNQPSVALTLIQNVQNISDVENDDSTQKKQAEVKGLGVVDPREVAALLKGYFDAPQAQASSQVDDETTALLGAIEGEPLQNEDST